MNQEQFYALIQEIEKRFPVADWRAYGVPVWPIARIAARAETFGLTIERPNPAKSRKFARLKKSTSRIISYVFSSLLVSARNRADWKREVLLLRKVDALFLGDNTSSDQIDGVWHDRYCAPVMEALDAAGYDSLLMQPDALGQRLPRGQDTYSINWIDRWGRLLAKALPSRKPHLPKFEEFCLFMTEKGLELDAFQYDALQGSGARVSAMARLFGHILARAQPKIAFIVSYYHDVGYALCLACRRRGILAVDLQHGGQDGGHEAYNRWFSLPPDGYSILPGLFWNWHQEDAQAIDAWATKLPAPWHQGLWAGHPQLAPWLDDNSPQARNFDQAIAQIKLGGTEAFDILVALQGLERFSETWNALADVVAASPPHWRWWLRRHPSPAYNNISSLEKILSVERPGIIIDEASALPLPGLLRNVDAVIAMISSTAFEASSFGHRAIFLSEDARSAWPQLIRSGKADIITDMDLLRKRLAEIEANRGQRQVRHKSPPLADTITTLFRLAREYKGMVREKLRPVLP